MRTVAAKFAKYVLAAATIMMTGMTSVQCVVRRLTLHQWTIRQGATRMAAVIQMASADSVASADSAASADLVGLVGSADSADSHGLGFSHFSRSFRSSHFSGFAGSAGFKAIFQSLCFMAPGWLPTSDCSGHLQKIWLRARKPATRLVCALFYSGEQFITAFVVALAGIAAVAWL